MDKTAAVAKDMQISMAYVDRARPILSRMLGGEIRRVEGSGDEIRQMLDLKCGIDYFQVYQTGIVWGVASRWQAIQPGEVLHNTFTIRKERESGSLTEYDKLRQAIRRGGERPHLTMQGYYSAADGRILSIGIARTEDIVRMIEEGHARVQKTGEGQNGQAWFYVVSWKEMARQGRKVIEWLWWENQNEMAG